MSEPVDKIVERLLMPGIGDEFPGGLRLSKRMDLRRKISGAVWDYLFVLEGGGGKFVMFAKDSGAHTSLLPVPSNVRL